MRAFTIPSCFRGIFPYVIVFVHTLVIVSGLRAIEPEHKVIDDIVQDTRLIESWIQRNQQILHSIPELKHEERMTSDFVRSVLSEMGISYRSVPMLSASSGLTSFRCFTQERRYCN